MKTAHKKIGGREQGDDEKHSVCGCRVSDRLYNLCHKQHVVRERTIFNHRNATGSQFFVS